MPASILSLFAVHFDTRISLEQCMVNVDGETKDCVIEKLAGGNVTSPTYVVFERDKQGTKGEELFTFNPYHLHAMDANLRSTMYSVSGAGRSGSAGTLIIPYPKWLYEPEDVDQDECNDTEVYLDSSCYPAA